MIVDEAGCGRPIASVRYVVKQSQKLRGSRVALVSAGPSGPVLSDVGTIQSCTVEARRIIKELETTLPANFQYPSSINIPSGHATPCVNTPAGPKDSQVCCTKVSRIITQPLKI
jgi:hypothetical protein